MTKEQLTSCIKKLKQENKFLRKKVNVNAMILRQWQKEHAESQLKPQEREREICECENPVPQTTLSHACQNCYKTLREYSSI